jgi:hypothetical protein
MVKNIKAGRTIKELEISFKDVNKGGLFSKIASGILKGASLGVFGFLTDKSNVTK